MGRPVPCMAAPSPSVYMCVCEKNALYVKVEKSSPFTIYTAAITPIQSNSVLMYCEAMTFLWLSWEQTVARTHIQKTQRSVLFSTGQLSSKTHFYWWCCWKLLRNSLFAILSWAGTVHSRIQPSILRNYVYDGWFLISTFMSSANFQHQCYK